MVNAGEALNRLKEGNRRFVRSSMKHPRCTPARRRATALRQRPFAAVLCCSDSRVVPELIFDQGIGDMFVVRSAGNVVDEIALGSLEYAVRHLRVTLILVLGHTSCGAVTAVMDHTSRPAGRIAAITSIIRRAAMKTDMHGPDDVARKHAEMTAASLRSFKPVLSSKCAEGKVSVAAAMYDVRSGTVEIIA